jgi:hypothetical protein
VTPETCPNCGAEVPRGARACPNCGADERTGWSDPAEAERLGIPIAEDFDYDRFVREEFGPAPKRSWRRIAWAIVALALLGLLLSIWLF